MFRHALLAPAAALAFGALAMPLQAEIRPDGSVGNRLGRLEPRQVFHASELPACPPELAALCAMPAAAPAFNMGDLIGPGFTPVADPESWGLPRPAEGLGYYLIGTDIVLVKHASGQIVDILTPGFSAMN